MAKLTRKCYSCKEKKDLSEFPSHSGKPHNKGYQCKLCCRGSQKGKYTKEEISVKNKKAMMKMKYGLSLEQIEQMKKDQNFKCKICKVETRLAVDHCHTSGRIRGLLCIKCNTGLGMFLDNVLFLKSAQEYLNNE